MPVATWFMAVGNFFEFANTFDDATMWVGKEPEDLARLVERKTPAQAKAIRSHMQKGRCIMHPYSTLRKTS